jgi:hypothetical protein
MIRTVYLHIQANGAAGHPRMWRKMMRCVKVKVIYKVQIDVRPPLCAPQNERRIHEIVLPRQIPVNKPTA